MFVSTSACLFRLGSRTSAARNIVASLLAGTILSLSSGCVASSAPTSSDRSAGTQLDVVAKAKPAPMLVPQGLYANYKIDDVIASAQQINPGAPLTQSQVDTVLQDYNYLLLSNPAVSGLTPKLTWRELEPEAGTYVWNDLDDVFAAITTWNGNYPGSPKTVQLIVSAGFNSPGWLFTELDNKGEGSCDGLFSVAATQHGPGRNCGYTTLFFQTEDQPTQQMPLPLPWNGIYQSEWSTFLGKLNTHIQTLPAASAFVSICIAGPTDSSCEMIMPNQQNQDLCLTSSGTFVSQNVPGCPTGGTANNGMLTLSQSLGLSSGTYDVATAWNMLFANYYTPKAFPDTWASYQNSDQAFIDAWDAAIDTYGTVFNAANNPVANGMTLVLTATTDALPVFTSSTPATTAPGFESDCGSPTAMNCAAVTQVLSYFAQSSAGGGNAKATQESGMTALRNQPDLSTNGVKWLAGASHNGTLPGGINVSRVMGGLQFERPFSGTQLGSDKDPQYGIDTEGCTTLPTTSCASYLTAEQGLYNVMSNSYFPGTLQAASFGASTSYQQYNFDYSNVRMNYVQAFATDIVYAEGLAGCSPAQLLGNPWASLPPDVSQCQVSMSLATYMGQTAQQWLALTNQQILSMAEPGSP